ncbi:MAG: ArgR family transcriptional regulator [Bacteroidales bacterium]|nr:ArgR family transcriptional regulator [Bacteroidales bacterium]
MQKTKRLPLIEKILTETLISSQDELLRKLKSKGISCTQATLSRDLRQLGVSRVPDGSGGYRYSLAEKNASPAERETKLHIISVISGIVEAKGLLLVKTIPGNASATAFYIDNAGRKEIAGTIAGDDTILVIPHDGISRMQVHTCLEIILPGLHEKLKKS